MTAADRWGQFRIGDLGRVVTGTTPPRELFGGGYPFLTPSDMSYGQRTVATERYISALGTGAFETRMLPVGAIAFVCIGATIGKMCVTAAPTLSNQQINALIVDDGSFDRDFVYYALAGQRGEIRSIATGAATPIINKSTFSNVTVRVPVCEVQQTIGASLRALDDLIENNRLRIEILEEMARLLYREWFVHFRYPGHEDVELVDSELGPIPQGWEISTFSDIVTEIKTSVAEDEIPAGSPIVGLEHLPRRSTTLVDWDVARDVGSRRKLFEEGDILFGKIRPYFHKVVDAPIGGYSSTDAIVFRPTEYAERALCVASSDEFVATAVGTSNGTKMPRANTSLLLGYRLPEPPTDIAKEFEALTSPMSMLRWNLSRQNQILRETRDLLLPRLVSGELDVSGLDLDGVVA